MIIIPQNILNVHCMLKFAQPPVHGTHSPFLTLLTFVLLGNDLKADTVFSAVNIFNVLQLYMCHYFPEAVARYGEASKAVERLERFLLQEEKGAEFRVISYSKNRRKPGTVKMADACVKKGHVPILQNLNLRIRPGILCCIVGDAEAGKSSFIHMLLKELPVSAGRMEVIGSVSYASQDPWLFSSTIRNNILFGRSYNRHRYREVVKVCGLESDFQNFPQRDQTMIGGRGVFLTEGQKARINLARAVYVDVDIYLLDDLFAAIATDGARDIFDECIREFLGNKTRILVTQQLEFLKEADLIVFLENGTISKVLNIHDLSEAEMSMLYARSPSAQNAVEDSSAEKKEIEAFEDVKEVGSCGIFMEYWKSGANKCILAILISLFVLGQLFTNISDLWVAYWVNSNSTEDHHHNNLPVIMDIVPRVSDFMDFDKINEDHFFIYVHTGMILCVILILANSLLFYRICIKASVELHKKMLSNIILAPMRFFNVCSQGIHFLLLTFICMFSGSSLLPQSSLSSTVSVFNNFFFCSFSPSVPVTTPLFF
ncbi:hypothetical protein JTB14_027161 [Gonioctena quinquepunctata]|nr:hypothetical protein JTB14_027161 [Gonioctena quinquepunctata]